MTVPVDWIPVEQRNNLKEWVLNAATEATELGLQPVSFVRAPENYNIRAYLPRILLSKFANKPEGMGLSGYIVSMFCAWLNHYNELAHDPLPVKPVHASEFGLRHEQVRLIHGAEKHMKQGDIVFAEAGLPHRLNQALHFSNLADAPCTIFQYLTCGKRQNDPTRQHQLARAYMVILKGFKGLAVV